MSGLTARPTTATATASMPTGPLTTPTPVSTPAETAGVSGETVVLVKDGTALVTLPADTSDDVLIALSRAPGVTAYRRAGDVQTVYDSLEALIADLDAAPQLHALLHRYFDPEG